MPADVRGAQRLAALSDEEIRAWVPIYCVAMNVKHPETNKLVTWQFDPAKPFHIRHGDLVLPSDVYPEDKLETVTALSGERVDIPYYEDAEGRRFYITCAVETVRWEWMMQEMNRHEVLVKAYRDAKGAEKAELGGRIRTLLTLWAERIDRWVITDARNAGCTAPRDADKLALGLRSQYYMGQPTPFIEYGFPQWLHHFYQQIKDYPGFREEYKPGVSYERFITRRVFYTALKFLNTTGWGAMIRNNWNHHFFNIVKVAQAYELPELAHYTYEFVMRSKTQYAVTSDGPSTESTGYGALWFGGPMALPLRDLREYADPTGHLSPRTKRHFAPGELEEELLTDLALHRLAAGEIETMFPDGSTLKVGDNSPWYGYRAYPLRNRSVATLLPAYGHGSLGDGTGGAQVVANLTGALKDNHGNTDSLNFTLYAHGRRLIEDVCNGYHNMSQQSVAHSMVSIDYEHSFQSGVRQETELWAPDMPGLSMVRMRQNLPRKGNAQPFPGMKTYRRTLLLNTSDLRHPYVVDVFGVEGGEHTHDYMVNGSDDHPVFPAKDGLSPTLKTNLKPMDTIVPKAMLSRSAYRIFIEPETTPLDQDGHVDLRYSDLPEQGVRIHLQGAADQQLILTSLPNHDPHPHLFYGSGRPIPKVILRHQRDTGAPLRSVFVVVYEPFKGETAIASTRHELVADGKGVSVSVQLKDGRTDRYLLALDQALPLAVDGLSTDGVMAAASSKGDAVDLWMVGGTRTTFGKRSLVAEHTNLSGGKVMAVRRVTHRKEGAQHAIVTDLPLPVGNALRGQVIWMDCHKPGATYWTSQRNTEEIYFTEPNRYTGAGDSFIKAFEILEVADEDGNRCVYVRNDPGLERRDGKWHEVFAPHHTAESLSVRFINQATTVPQIRLSPDKGRYLHTWTNDFVPFVDELNVDIATVPKGAPVQATLDGAPTDPGLTGRVKLSKSAELAVRARNPGGTMQPRPVRMRYLKAFRPVSGPAAEGLEPGAWLTPYRLPARDPQNPTVAFDLVKEATRAPNAKPVPLDSLQDPWIDRESHGTRSSQPTGTVLAYLRAPETGVYEFATLSQPGSVLYVDGEIVVEAYHRGDLGRWSGRVALEQGLHLLRIDQINPVHRKVWWRTPSMQRLALIPGKALFRDAALLK